MKAKIKHIQDSSIRNLAIKLTVEYRLAHGGIVLSDTAIRNGNLDRVDETFDWCHSEQGYDYWKNINDEIIEVLKYNEHILRTGKEVKYASSTSINLKHSPSKILLSL